MLLTSVAAGALLQRYVAATFTSIFAQYFLFTVDLYDCLVSGELFHRFLTLREVPGCSGALVADSGGIPAMINLRTAFWRRRPTSRTRPLIFPPLLVLGSILAHTQWQLS